jgi:protein-disulfide isomerase/uncharacterized membrane protein
MGVEREREKRSVGRAPFVVALVAALAGVGLSVDLLHTHRVANEEGSGPAWCDTLGEGVGCSSVARSSWAKVFGVPTAAWALLVYVGIAALAVAGLRRGAFVNGPGGILFWVAVGCLLFGFFLVYVMVTEVEDLCPSCLGLDAVHLVLLVSGGLAIRGRRGPIVALRHDLTVLSQNPPLGIAVVGGPILAGLLVLLAYPRDEGQEGFSRSDGDVPELPDAGWYEEEINTEGVPCMGPADAPLVIHEFSDYQCPYCRRAHHEMRRVARRLEGHVRFCHFHHPLDMECNPRISSPFHTEACLAASAAICAQAQGHFWEMNDRLFMNARDLDASVVMRLASSLELDTDRFAGCLESESTRARIGHELAEAHEVPVTRTPTFIMNGRIIPGALPADVLEVMLRELLEHEGRWPGRRVRD